MLKVKDMIIHLIVGLIKKTWYKWVITFVNDINVFMETLVSKLIYLIMQQKLI